MALLTLREEYNLVREAIQKLVTSEKRIVQIVIDGQTYQFAQDQIDKLYERESMLANRLCSRNRRKRTCADFT